MIKQVKYNGELIDINIAEDEEFEENINLVNLEDTLELFNKNIKDISLSDTLEMERPGDSNE